MSLEAVSLYSVPMLSRYNQGICKVIGRFPKKAKARPGDPFSKPQQLPNVASAFEAFASRKLTSCGQPWRQAWFFLWPDDGPALGGHPEWPSGA